MQNYQLELEQREMLAIELANKLDKLNAKIAKLRLEKESLEVELIAAIGHNLEGSKTYDVGDKAVTLKTDMIYSLNKDLYNDDSFLLPADFDPVVTKTVFEVNKKSFNSMVATAPAHVCDMLHALVTKKPSKPAVTIKART